MRLTPADVHNVAFKKPSIGKRGYDEDEVDAFLDIVEAELISLIEENNELRQQLAAYESGQATPGAGTQVAAPAQTSDGDGFAPYGEPAPEGAAHGHGEAEAGELYTHAEAPTAEQPAVIEAGPALQQAPAPAEEPAEVAAPVAPVAPVAAPVAPVAAVAVPADHHLQAARLLGLAQETAERLTGEASAEAAQTRAGANAEAEQVRTDARNESEQVRTDARNESERMLSEAKNASESMVEDATAKAESTIRDSQIKAEAMDREAQRQYSEVMTQLTTQRTSLENKIDGLRTYEREYRSRLKSWISDQLQQLDAGEGDGSPAQPAESEQTDSQAD